MQQGERHDGASCEDFRVRTGVETGGCGNEQMAGLDEQVVDGRAGAPVSGGMTFDPSGGGQRADGDGIWRGGFRESAVMKATT